MDSDFNLPEFLFTLQRIIDNAIRFPETMNTSNAPEEVRCDIMIVGNRTDLIRSTEIVPNHNLCDKFVIIHPISNDEQINITSKHINLFKEEFKLKQNWRENKKQNINKRNQCRRKFNRMNSGR
jgi:hypothetical protein